MAEDIEEMTPSRDTTVLFADVSGSTRLYETAGDAAAHEAIARCLEKLREAAELSGGRVVKTIGDEVMYVGLTAETVTASLALRDAAAAEALPPLRIGLAAGLVVSRAGDYFGPVVNLASRLTELAEPGEVLVPAALRDELRSGSGMNVRCVPRGSHHLRSIGSVEVFALERSG
jgi:adenylate cyclase